jgi:hypothetical protein
VDEKTDGKIIKLTDYSKPERLKKYAGSANGVCYTGLSASFQTEESDVIVVAASIEDLEWQWMRLRVNKLNLKSVEQVAVFRFKDMRGKRLFK